MKVNVGEVAHDRSHRHQRVEFGVKKVGADVIKKDDPHTLLFLVDDREVVAVCMLEDFDELAKQHGVPEDVEIIPELLVAYPLLRGPD